jgi:hypothetical protein
VSAGDDLAYEMKSRLNELLAKLWMCEKRDFIGYRDAVFALFDRAVAPLVQCVPQDWLIVDGLLYRLNEYGVNCDEINVTMANGSRKDGSRNERAQALLKLLSAGALPAPVVQQPSRNEVLEAAAELCDGYKFEGYSGVAPSLASAIRAMKNSGGDQ